MAGLSPMDALLLLEEEKRTYEQFLQSPASQDRSNAVQVLRTIPAARKSYGPIATLSALIARHQGSWPPLELQQAHIRAWKDLPEAAKSGKASAQAQELVERTLQQCKRSYSSLPSLISSSSKEAAIIDPESGRTFSHNDVTACVRNFKLPLPSSSKHTKPVVAISLPNGPLLALTVVATASYYTAAPIAHGSGVGAEQFKTDVLQSKSNMVLASRNDVGRLGLRDDWLRDNHIRVLLVKFGSDSKLDMQELDGGPVNFKTDASSPIPNTADDTGIMLFTSGTSGTKKLVPLSVHSMVCGVAMVIESWGLTPQMRCLNQMPLNHVGGLIRNLFAPILSRGSVICCSAFDANLFWDCVEDYAPTWYYASPTMHQCILEAGAQRQESLAKSRIRLICNAAGGLLPSLALQLRETFSNAATDCIVLPSYGMTECMPISTPPLDYRLDKTGTSGITVGPEIGVLDGNDKLVGPGSVGRVGVRGAPLFEGYLKANYIVDTSCFTEAGWFDTGDMGYLDEQGYLYITGRSKEVINRGGELISPFEVEEAIVVAASTPNSPTYGRISKALAFSVPHDVLQEVVGIAVITPNGSKRADLRSITDSVKGTLSSVKVPVVVVYMEDLPTNNNKILRIKLADRLSLDTISDSTPVAGHYFEATCPPINTPLHVPIASKQMATSLDGLAEVCQNLLPSNVVAHARYDATGFYPELILAPKSTQSLIDQNHCEMILASLAETCHGYQVPSSARQLEVPLPQLATGAVDDAAINDIISSGNDGNLSSDMSPTEAAVAKIFSEILSVPASKISGESDFFELGGDSMKAGRLLSSLRKEFRMRLAIDALFTNSTVSGLSMLIAEKQEEAKLDSITEDTASTPEDLLPDAKTSHSSTNPFLLFLQLIPIGLFFPMRRALTWTIFVYGMAFSQHLVLEESIPGRLTALVVAMGVANAVTKLAVPVLAIIFKWLVIGRYREGVWPMWGFYHTRWWLCEKVICISGIGIWGWFDYTRVLYYRCLGVKMGKNVTIDRGATLGEYDLITLGDNVNLERCTVRPFGAEKNTSMYLGRITIGANSSVGLASIVAPGTTLAPDTCIGPNSSSWEMDADESNRNLASSKIPEPHWLISMILGLPIRLLCTFVGAIPWLAALVALVNQPPNEGVKDEVRRICLWFAAPQRVGYHYLAIGAGASAGPLFFFVIVLVFKKLFNAFFGPVVPSEAANRSQMTKFRLKLFRTLMPAPQFHKVTELFGIHYEMTSIFMRAMGAKVGKRVYWPGTGPSVQDYDLVEVGDDVVFGSRSHLVTSDGNGNDYVRINNGAMVADRVVLLPGVEVGQRTVMGSGALTKRGTHYPADTTWVGSKQGEAICLNTFSGSKGDQPSRSERYHETRKTPHHVAHNLDSYNSSSTTLEGTNLVSGASSITFAEKGHGMFGSKRKSAGKQSKSAVVVSEKSSHGDASSSSPSSSSPFGRAFYQGLAPYRVWSQVEITIYSTVIVIGTVIFWNIGSISAVQVVARLYQDEHFLAEHFLAETFFRPFSLYCFFLVLIMGIMAIQSIAVLAFLIAAKWILMGRRQQGNYDWDKSPYCQRWQLFLKLESLRRNCYGGHGVLGMLTGTHWIVLYFRGLGASIGKDCSLFSSGSPSLVFTEPDLLTLGDRVSVDDASLVGHINTRGKFDLNPLYVGDRSVLRSGSRLLSGARMEADTCLLEHTLVMAGDIVDEGCTNQGWPAEEFKGSRMPTLFSRNMSERA